MYIMQIPTLFIISSLQALTILTRLGIRRAQQTTAPSYRRKHVSATLIANTNK
jgi:hypothetical protein